MELPGPQTGQRRKTPQAMLTHHWVGNQTKPLRTSKNPVWLARMSLDSDVWPLVSNLHHFSMPFHAPEMGRITPIDFWGWFEIEACHFSCDSLQKTNQQGFPRNQSMNCVFPWFLAIKTINNSDYMWLYTLIHVITCYYNYYEIHHGILNCVYCGYDQFHHVIIHLWYHYNYSFHHDMILCPRRSSTASSRSPPDPNSSFWIKVIESPKIPDRNR